MKKIILIFTIFTTQINTTNCDVNSVDRLKIEAKNTANAGLNIIDRLLERTEFSQIRIASKECSLLKYVPAATSLLSKDISNRELRKLLSLSKEFSVNCTCMGINVFIKQIEGLIQD
jgi:hypothetical protein